MASNGKPELVFGIVTVGERGQIVIPADARRYLGIEPGDKMIVVAHHSGRALIVAPLRELERFIRQMQDYLEGVQREPEEDEEQ